MALTASLNLSYRNMVFLSIRHSLLSLSLLLSTGILSGCTDRIEATLPPSNLPSLPVASEIPAHLRQLFSTRCAQCHGEKGEGKTAGNIFRAPSRPPRSWANFLKNPTSVDPHTKHSPIMGLTNVEYAAFGEWLARITKDNPAKLGNNQ
jgi:cytochrome c553